MLLQFASSARAEETRCLYNIELFYNCANTVYMYIFQKTTICDFWKPIKFQSKFYIELYTCASATNGPIPLQTIHQW